MIIGGLTETLRITEVIRRLQELRERHGNLPVTMSDWQDLDMPDKVTDIRMVIVKEHCDGYVITERLDTGGFAGREKFNEPYQSEVKARPDQKVILIE